MFFKRNPSSQGNPPAKTNRSLPKEKAMFLKFSNRIASKDRMLRSILQLPQSTSGQPYILLSATSQMTCLEKNRCVAIGNDPYFLLHIPQGHTHFSIEVQISSSQDNRPIALYYSFENTMALQENNKVSLGKTDGQKQVHHLVFPAPVFWLRLDPIDRAVDYTVLGLSVACMHADVDERVMERVGSSADLPILLLWQNLEEQLREPRWTDGDKIVFVTHELSGTGAPLLCRKMSRMAQQLGKTTIILALPNPLAADEEMIRSFQDDCDVLLICSNQEDVAACVTKLRAAGVKKAVLSSVVCGSVVQLFRDAGIQTVSLIHEMRCSCKILQAEKWIEMLAQHADTIVFPARCVQEDFVSFGNEIQGNTLIMPQGLYRNLDGKTPGNTSSKARKALLKTLHLPEDAILFLGVGSINFGKGTDLLPLIAQEMLKSGEGRVHFLWLGTTNEHRYEVWLLNQIQKMGLADHFHFLGYVSDESEYMNIIQGCLALALVSREDSYPSVMMEAMSSGIPVAAFRGSGGAQDLLDDGRGYLVDYMNIRQYAQVLRSMYENPENTKKITDRAKEYIHRSTNFETYVRSILDAFAAENNGVSGNE